MLAPQQRKPIHCLRWQQDALLVCRIALIENCVIPEPKRVAKVLLLCLRNFLIGGIEAIAVWPMEYIKVCNHLYALMNAI